MRRLLIILCILLGSCQLALADNLAMADTVSNITHTIMGGVVKSVSWADSNKGTRSEIVVIDAAKKAIHIFVTPTTTLWDADAEAIMPETITARMHVNVIYLRTPEGINIGKSIKILK